MSDAPTPMSKEEIDTLRGADWNHLHMVDRLVATVDATESKLSIAVAALERIGKTQTIGTPVAQVSTKWDRHIAREALERIKEGT